MRRRYAALEADTRAASESVTALDADLAGINAALAARDAELARLQVAHRRQGADLLDERDRVLVLQEEVHGAIG